MGISEEMNMSGGDITSQGGRAIVWHLRQGKDNGEMPRDALALWIDDICNQHDVLTAALDGCVQWLAMVLDQVDYTTGACQLNEMVGACLPQKVIEQARAALETVKKARL